MIFRELCKYDFCVNSSEKDCHFLFFSIPFSKGVDERMEKKKLREQKIQQLKELNQFSERKKEKEACILAQLFESESWKSAKSVAAVISLGFEFDTSKIFARGWQENKQMAAPKSFSKGKMVFYETNSDTVHTISTFGVKEPDSTKEVTPDELELIIVPGLVFSKSGYRIGFGGGYYDRYLSNYKGNTCSLVFEEQFHEDWTFETFDVPVAHLFTDSKGVDL